ncbi:CapA family protein [Paenibacillus cremeus]|uniref:CapA family protein n=1 Tax=Paenibacillus cremeus TaxID=2163881 RepID=A0A559KI14_9BACL|nr:CapA family protein [Paenibacillus cremeus]TVY11761.1 CapA family protein [Paenibacillus cremeus]
MPEIRIAAVGDLMVKLHLISEARLPDGYSFDRLFSEVAPFLKRADLTIGNLETTFAGSDSGTHRKRKSAGPLFSCPDEFAHALKKAGFDVLTTANNHSLDTGVKGLVRTLDILDQNGLAHTGTFRSLKESRSYLIRDVQGIRVGILSYTKGTNRIPDPAGKPWMVNRIAPRRIVRDLQKLKAKTDLIVVCLHFGSEYFYHPTAGQKRLVSLLFRKGAHIILGSHPHVLQTSAVRGKRHLAIYSLGNFVSTRLKNNPHTQSGIILNVKVSKPRKGKVSIQSVSYVPTWVHRNRSVQPGQAQTQVIPNTSEQKELQLSSEEQQLMKQMLRRTAKLLGG